MIVRLLVERVENGIIDTVTATIVGHVIGNDVNHQVLVIVSKEKYSTYFFYIPFLLCVTHSIITPDRKRGQSLC